MVRRKTRKITKQPRKKTASSKTVTARPQRRRKGFRKSGFKQIPNDFAYMALGAFLSGYIGNTKLAEKIPDFPIIGKEGTLALAAIIGGKMGNIDIIEKAGWGAMVSAVNEFGKTMSKPRITQPVFQTQPTASPMSMNSPESPILQIPAPKVSGDDIAAIPPKARHKRELVGVDPETLKQVTNVLNQLSGDFSDVSGDEDEDVSGDEDEDVSGDEDDDEDEDVSGEFSDVGEEEDE